MTQLLKRACEHDTTKAVVGIDKRFSRTDMCLKKQLGSVGIGTVPEECRRQRFRSVQPAIAYDGFLPRLVFAFCRHFLFMFPVLFLSSLYGSFHFHSTCLPSLISYFRSSLRTKKSSNVETTSVRQSMT
jgi:hypothetical protein